ncbi:MAG: holo-ACP synthase [Anaerolineae bacterium]|jgi:holo-[acyl-carrier protein] synthase
MTVMDLSGWDDDGAGTRVGVDLVEISRIARAYERWGERFLTRVYSPTEQADSRGRVSSLAARFAAKEAAAKALGTGIGPIGWLDVEVLVGERGRPLLRLRGPAAEIARQLGLRRAAVSLSDTREHALAVVVLT